MAMKRSMTPFSMNQTRLLFVLGMVFLFLSVMSSGCAPMKKQTKEEPTYEKIPFSEIVKSPDTYRGRTVRLGGVIIKTENREEETRIEILEKPLSWRGRPKPGDDSGGRFMVVFEKFLDQAIYRPSRPVTVVGEITGTERASVGEKAYNYPLLSGREIRLWDQGRHFYGPRMHIGIGIGGGSGGIGIGTSF